MTSLPGIKVNEKLDLEEAPRAPCTNAAACLQWHSLAVHGASELAYLVALVRT